MSDVPGDRHVLLEKIRAKRAAIDGWLARVEPKQSRLLRLSIVAGALAAGLTAGPGIGGEGFIAAAKGVVTFGVPVWQVLCLLATLLSVATVIANGLLKSGDVGARIAAVRTCDAKLEGLATQLELDQIALSEAAAQYSRYLTEVPEV